MAITLCYWAASTSATAMIKRVLHTAEDASDAGLAAEAREGRLPLPLALTGLTNTCVALAGSTICALAGHWGRRSAKPPPPPPRMQPGEWRRLLLVGALNGCQIACINAGIARVGLTTYALVMALGPAWTMIVSRLVGLESCTPQKSLALVLLTAGLAIQGLHSSRHDGIRSSSTAVWGSLLLLLATLAGAGRWVCTQLVLTAAPPHTALGQLTKLGLTWRMSAMVSAQCLAGSCLLEGGAGLSLAVWASPALSCRVLAIASAILGTVLAQISLVARTSAMALEIASALHLAPLIAVGTLLFGERVSAWQVAGFGCCSCGALVYGLAKEAERARQSSSTFLDLEGSPVGKRGDCS